MNALTHDLRLAAKAANQSGSSRSSRWQVLLRAAAAVVTAVGHWRAERRAVARLSSYPDAMLKDIGLSRGGIDWAVRHGHREEPAEDAPKALAPERLP